MIGLFISSISSWFSFGGWYISKNLSISSRFSFSLAYICCGTLLEPSQWLSSKESVCNERDTGDADWILGSGRSPGGGHGNPFQCSCLESLTGQRSLVGSIEGHRVQHDGSDLACTQWDVIDDSTYTWKKYSLLVCFFKINFLDWKSATQVFDFQEFRGQEEFQVLFITGGNFIQSL